MSLRRYEEYRNSGLEWLDEVPAHWAVPVPLGSISSLKGRLGWQGLKAEEYRDEGPYVVSSAHFADFKVRWEDCPRVSRERYEVDVNIQLAVGDILLMKDGSVGKLAFIDSLPGDACLNSHLLMFRPLTLHDKPTYFPKYAFYFMQSPLFQEGIKLRGSGTTFLGVSQEAISKIRVVWPPLNEQEAIATFLDRETAKVDALIAEQEKLIALLAEKRQATISHSVTKGLDPDAPLKDSGLAWLGEVPAHWLVRRMKTVSPEITVGIVVEPSKYYVDEGVPALRSLNILAGRITTENMVYISEKSNDMLAKSRLRAGDLVSVRSGQTGITAVVPDELDGCNCIDLIILRQPLQDCGRFLCWYFASDAALLQFAMGSGGAIQQHFNIGMAMNLHVPLPPIEEQRAIAAFLDSEALKLDALRAEAERAIALLKERRSALIAAAVTGQIDVRDVAAPTKNIREKLTV